MRKITGVTAKTPENLLLNAGAFFKNYIPETDTPEMAKEKLIGATQGGGSFSAIPTIRKIGLDGMPNNVKGGDIIDEWVVTMVANTKEVTSDNLQIALGGTTMSPAAPPGYEKIIARNSFEDSDYLENITWIGTLNKTQEPIIIVLKNALSLSGLTLTMTDKNEAIIPITVTGHYDPENIDEAPFEIYYPRRA